MNKNQKNIVVWIAIACFFYLLFQAFSNGRGGVVTVAYSDFLSKVESGKVAKVAIRGSSIEGVTTDGEFFSTYDPRDWRLIDRLIAKNVHI